MITVYFLFVIQALQKLSFSHENYVDLLQRYNKEPGSVDKIACDWLIDNEESWQFWIPTSDEKNDLVIGGIFPMSGSNYIAKGIVRGKINHLRKLNNT